MSLNSAKSGYGVDLHRNEAKRAELSGAGVIELVQNVQLFSALTKIADGQHLEPDFL